MNLQTLLISISSLILFEVTAALFMQVYVLSLMFMRRRLIRQNPVNFLLLANTYIAASTMSIYGIDMVVYSFYAYTHPDASFDDSWCKTKGYLVYIGGCTFFYTFATQAFYRFCRILYRTNARLQSFRLHAILSVSIWFFTALELLPSFIIGDIEYIPKAYSCQFSAASLRGSLTVYSVGFVLPFSVTVFFYTWTMLSIRRRSMVLLNIDQRASINRDIVILKRLLILLSVVTAVGTPHVLLPVIYVFTGPLFQWIVPLRYLLSEMAVLGVTFVLFMVTPQLRQLRTTVRTGDTVRPMATVPVRLRN